MGRPRVKYDVPLKKWSYTTKDHTDFEQEIFYDEEKYSKGSYGSRVVKWGMGELPPSPKINKNQKYVDAPVVMAFKSSNRSNAKTKIKVWRNTNIDYILRADKLPGIPKKAVILEVGIGEVFIEKYKDKYNL
jgi:hypothetical protein